MIKNISESMSFPCFNTIMNKPVLSYLDYKMLKFKEGGLSDCQSWFESFHEERCKYFRMINICKSEMINSIHTNLEIDKKIFVVAWQISYHQKQTGRNAEKRAFILKMTLPLV